MLGKLSMSDHTKTDYRDTGVFVTVHHPPNPPKFPLATTISEYSQHVALERSICQALAQHGSSNLHIT